MKSFVFSIVLFIILISLSLLNSSFILSRSEELLYFAENIPAANSSNCAEKLDAFNNKWNEFKKAASLTISYSELNRIDCLLGELYVHLKNTNIWDFDSSLKTIKVLIQEISRFERFSFETVF